MIRGLIGVARNHAQFIGRYGDLYANLLTVQAIPIRAVCRRQLKTNLAPIKFL